MSCSRQSRGACSGSRPRARRERRLEGAGAHYFEHALDPAPELAIEPLLALLRTEGFEEMLDVVLSTEYAHHQRDGGIALEGVVNAAEVAGIRGPRVRAARTLLRVLDPALPKGRGASLN